MNLQFGLSAVIPQAATTGWGARLIFPDEMLWDRQSFEGRDTPQGKKLHAWLNGGALKKALTAARRMSRHFTITPDSRQQVTLYEDAIGCIVGNPNASYGYLYVAGWLKEENTL